MKGVDQNSIDHFSKRRDQIEAYMKEHGVNKEIANSKTKEIANSKTRKSKDEMPIDKAREKWADESKQITNAM